MRPLIFSCLVLLVTWDASAQPAAPLFDHRVRQAAAADAREDARGVVASRTAVDIRVEQLFDEADGARARVLLNTGEHEWTAELVRVDSDPNGFRTWVGRIPAIADSHVAFSERDGVVSGLIDAAGISYQIRAGDFGLHSLELLDISRFADEADPLSPDGAFDAIPGPADESSNPPASAEDDAGTFDVLMLYTAAARARAGGTAQIEGLIAQIISHTNTAFQRSAIIPRVRLIGARELSFTETSDLSSDLTRVRTQSGAPQLRDSMRADLVQLLVYSPSSPSCGVGYQLSSTTATSFEAYSISDVDCASQYTPTHEMAHNLGAMHAPEDGGFGALFPYSYGYKDAARGFRTVMAYACATVICPRALNFSNPSVSERGGPAGSAAQNNARTINEIAAVVANFRRATSTTPAPPSMPPPNAPTDLRAEVAGNAVTLTWTPVSSAVYGSAAYVLQVGTAAGASNLYAASLGGSTQVSGVVGSGTYYWRVAAVYSSGASAGSPESVFTIAPACVATAAPTALSHSVANGVVTLTWQPSAGAVSYLLEAGSAAGSANLVNQSVGLSTSLSAAAPPGIYYVRIRAQNACGLSAASNEQLIRVP